MRQRPAQIVNLQEKKLRVIIRYAYEYVPFYHELFKKSRVAPADIKTIGDMSKIPTITREDIQKSFHHMIPRNVDLRRCMEEKTSGSMGFPISVFLDPNASLFRRTVALRQFFECGGRLTDRQLQFRSARRVAELSKHKALVRLGIPRTEYVAISFSSIESVIALIESHKPDIIVGYPNFLQILSENIHHEANTRLIFTLGEVLGSHSRAEIESAFEADVIDCYGCVEVGDISWECPDAQEYYHVNADSVLVEFVKEGESVASGEKGEIILTALYNNSMPIIRYRIGDMGTPTDEKCPCGRPLPLMRSIIGRTNDIIVLPDGTKLDPLSFMATSCLVGVSQYRIVQERKNLIKVLLKPKHGFRGKSISSRYASFLRRVVGDDVEVRIEIVSRIPREKSGKLRCIVSKVA